MTGEQLPDGEQLQNDPGSVELVVSPDGLLASVHAQLQAALAPLPPNPEWEKIVTTLSNTANAIKEGRTQGISELYLSQAAWKFVAEFMNRKQYGVIVNFLTSVGFGTPSQIAHFASLDKMRKAEIAAEVRLIEELEPEQQPHLEIHSEATMRQLFLAIEALPAAERAFVLGRAYDELGDFHQYFEELQDDSEAAEGVRVIDFFDSYIDPEFPDQMPLPIRWIQKSEWEKRQQEQK